MTTKFGIRSRLITNKSLLFIIGVDDLKGYIANSGELVLQTRWINRFREFVLYARTKCSAVDTSELLISYDSETEILKISEFCQIEGHNNICNLLTRIINEIEYHVNGVLCKRDTLVFDEFDQRIVESCMERMGDYSAYDLYDFKITEDETGFHIYYWPINEPAAAAKYSVRLEKRETFAMNSLASGVRKYGIIFGHKNQYVKLGQDTITGAQNAFTLLVYLSKILAIGSS